MQIREQDNRRQANRWAFSMIEILIVIGIIGLLTALIVFAMGPSLQNARVAATRTTIAKLHDIVQQRVDAIARMDVSVEAKKLAALNSGMNVKQAEFLIRQNLYKQALPQRPEDLLGLDGPSGGASDDAPWRAAWLATGVQEIPIYEQLNSELLLFALTQGEQLRVVPSGKSYSVPVLDIGQINPKHVADGDGNGLSEFVDEWNNPLRFFSAPTRLIRSDGTAITPSDLQLARILISGLSDDTTDTGPNGKDPFDPTATLSSAFSSSFDVTHAPGGGNTLNNCPAFGEDDYHTPNTYYVPLIVSLGPDGQDGGVNALGLFEPTDTSATGRHLGMVDTATAGALTDNITNRQQ